MKAILFNVAPYELDYLEQANRTAELDLTFVAEKLTVDTVKQVEGCDVVSGFVTDQFDQIMMEQLSNLGVRLIVLRCAGYDHVDLIAAKNNHIAVANAASYSPTAVAEQAILLLLALVRHLNQAQRQMRQGNFLLDHLLGTGLHGRAVGIVGTGAIGAAFAQICRGMGCAIYGYDPFPNAQCQKLGLTYLSLPELLAHCDIISLHCVLDETTQHLINAETLRQIKRGALLINTSRGAVVDTNAVLTALDSGQLSGFAADVYEFEKGLYFTDQSQAGIQDQLFLQLLGRDDVVMTPHQAFLTQDAIRAIAMTTIENIVAFRQGHIQNQVGA